MRPDKKIHPEEKSNLHPRNKHRARYDFKQLIKSSPNLERFVRPNEYRDLSIDFFNPAAVKALNKALLRYFYKINFWDIPEGYLCPPIPGRADYLHYIADVLGATPAGASGQKIPKGAKVTCLDVGVGANCVYPIIGHQEYGWSFIGSDIDPVAIASGRQVVDQNPALQGHIDLRLQTNPGNIFKGILRPEERIDVTICNPPFHASKAEAQAGSRRKVGNLKQQRVSAAVLNFGGQSNELWCKGGEPEFIANMVRQSKGFGTACLWFSTLVSKQANVPGVHKALQAAGVLEVKTIPMSQGNKASRLIAWTFQTPEQQKIWRDTRWR
ncbi:23S rRNA (adenine(1618)-N(6))-methyltransferase RlmF [Nibribacter ruber]|uniref:Ribosomal RNA large subunit methyltransferase F n=1 Tax=Nibribacter ruber TaxID=2698458 RepID=A0A6P1NSE1_9BACT|nr:23S rRNA (adenine(1618)-N(6))-methyltransferase RlmF [Nibribacter ruber]QHL86756.1 23S rRNA (adenine(1618)-N(6))-methyltransferase RlmF [Nibribacter ruber]